MPIAEVYSRERPFDALCRQTGFDVSVVVYIFCIIIVNELKRVDPEIDKKRADNQEQANPQFGADIKINLIVINSHRLFFVTSSVWTFEKFPFLSAGPARV